MEKEGFVSKLICFSVALCLLASLTILSSAKGAPASGPRYGEILKISDNYDGVSIGYPAKIVRPATSSRQVAPAIETLLRIDKTGKDIPWLATRVINNVAAKTLTLILRQGVKFHDGTDFNAEAVKWNLEQHLSAKSLGTEKFRSIDVVDDYTVRINLTEWDSTVTSNLSQNLGMVISPTAYKQNGEQWCANHPVGTGPFRFVSWEKDVRTIYKKFDSYWQKGKPYLDGIEWIPIQDTLTRQLSLKKGELDLALGLAPKDLVGLEKEGYVVNRVRVGSGAYALIPDSANPKSPFADVRVRQSAQYAIDNETLVKAILYGEAEPANQYVYKGHWGYNPSVVGYPYNPAKARELLAEAGYPNGFKTKLLYRSNPQEDQLFTAIQGYLKAVGIDAELDPAQMGRFDQMAIQGGKWEGLIQNNLLPYPDVAAALATRYSGGKSFSMMLIPDEYGKAIKNAIAAPDFETKQKWTQEAMKLMIDKYCLQIVFYCRSDSAVSKTSVHNHGFLGTPNAGWWTPEDAWIER